jgi:hypothetical protein
VAFYIAAHGHNTVQSFYTEVKKRIVTLTLNSRAIRKPHLSFQIVEMSSVPRLRA